MRLTLIALVIAMLAGCTKSEMTETAPPAQSQKESVAEKNVELQKHQNAEFDIPEKEILVGRLKAQYEAADPNSEAGKSLKSLLDKETAELETLKQRASDTKPEAAEIITSDLKEPEKK